MLHLEINLGIGQEEFAASCHMGSPWEILATDRDLNSSLERVEMLNPLKSGLGSYWRFVFPVRCLVRRAVDESVDDPVMRSFDEDYTFVTDDIIPVVTQPVKYKRFKPTRDSRPHWSCRDGELRFESLQQKVARLLAKESDPVEADDAGEDDDTADVVTFMRQRSLNSLRRLYPEVFDESS